MTVWLLSVNNNIYGYAITYEYAQEQMNTVINQLIKPGMTSKVINQTCTHLFSQYKVAFIITIFPVQPLSEGHARQASPMPKKRKSNLRKSLTMNSIEEEDW